MASKPKKKKKKSDRKPGRQAKLTVTPSMIEEVKILAGRGLTAEQIYLYFGVHRDCWYDTIKRHPELGEAVKEGKIKALAMVAGKLMKAIHEGNLTAIIFYLKTQARWSENSNVKGEETDEQKTKYTIETTDPVEAARIYQQIMTGS
jgi:hypothetical protein